MTLLSGRIVAEDTLKRLIRGKIVVTMVVAVLVLNGAFAVLNARRVMATEILVVHSHEVLEGLASLLSSVKDAETGQRGYLITGISTYLKPYEAAITAVHGRLESLKALTLDDALQQQQLEALRPLMEAKLAELRRTVDFRRQARDSAGGEEAARAVVMTGEGQRLMDALRGRVADAIASEHRMLEERGRASEAALWQAIASSLAGLAGSLGLVAVAISLNRRLQKEQEQAILAREEILAMVSHDLRNPLGLILLTTRVLAKGGAPEERRLDLPDAVGKIQRAAERMVRLTEDLLDFASIEAGRLAIKRQPQDPGSMIHETLTSFEPLAREKRLRLTGNVAPHLPKVHCDRSRIVQVLSNLVGNATKVTTEGGHISLRVEALGHKLVFAVSDTGPGISEEDVKHLFERYWRSGEAQYRGTGLGLAIARGIVNAHGGRIWAESELGRGATLLFTIPVMGTG